MTPFTLSSPAPTGSSRRSPIDYSSISSWPSWPFPKKVRTLLFSLSIAANCPWSGFVNPEGGHTEDDKAPQEALGEEKEPERLPLPLALQQNIERSPPEELHTLLGYLLSWSLVLDHCALRSPEFRSRLGSYLRRSSLPLQSLMRVLCQHLQHSPSGSLPSPQTFKIAGTASARCSRLCLLALCSLSPPPIRRTFNSPPPDMVSTSDEWIDCYAAHLYLRLLQAFPALVRLWWTDDCDRQTAALIEKYISSCDRNKLCTLSSSRLTVLLG